MTQQAVVWSGEHDWEEEEAAGHAEEVTPVGVEAEVSIAEVSAEAAGREAVFWEEEELEAQQGQRHWQRGAQCACSCGQEPQRVFGREVSWRRHARDGGHAAAAAQLQPAPPVQHPRARALLRWRLRRLRRRAGGVRRRRLRRLPQPPSYRQLR